MDRTPFAGLTIVAPDESVYEDGASFLTRNPALTDYLLRLGAKTHRHDGHSGLPSPAAAPTVSSDTGGFLAPETTFHIGFTLLDADGGETTVSPLATVTTPAALPAPSAAPGLSLASGAGLTTGTYYYAITATDGLGGETTLSPSVRVSPVRLTTVTLTNLQALRGPDSFSVVIYKSTGGAFFKVVETVADTWTDDGTPCADCTLEPPPVNTTFSQFLLNIAVPSAAVASATAVRIYASTEPELVSPALLTTLASGALTTQMTHTQYAAGSPPPVTMSKGGANLIDPDTELIDWRWKRPVTASALLPAGEPGDVRLVIDPVPEIYAVGSASAAGPEDWVPIVMYGPKGDQGDQGEIGEPGPLLFPKGEFAQASGYSAYDSVTLNGSSYWAASAIAPSAAIPGQAPWTLIATRGERGPEGGPGMRWFGEYDPFGLYPLDSVVSFGDQLWVAAGSGIAPGLYPGGSGGVEYRDHSAFPLVENVGFGDTLDPDSRLPSQFSGVYGGHPGMIFYFDVEVEGTVRITVRPVPGHPTWTGAVELFSVHTDTTSEIPLAQTSGLLRNSPAAYLQLDGYVAAGRYFVFVRGTNDAEYGAFTAYLNGTATFTSDYDGYWDNVFDPAVGGGGSGHVIASGGMNFPAESVLEFDGPLVSVEDDAVGGRTIVHIDTPTIVKGPVTFPQRSTLLLSGAVTVGDDADADTTSLAFTGGGSGGGGGMPAYSDIIIAAAPIAYYPLDSDADAMGGDPLVGSGGAAAGNALDPFGGLATFFDGISQCFVLPSSLLASIGTGHLTIEGLYKLETPTASGAFVKVGAPTEGFGVGVGNGDMVSPGTNFVVINEQRSWAPQTDMEMQWLQGRWLHWSAHINWANVSQSLYEMMSFYVRASNGFGAYVLPTAPGGIGGYPGYGRFIRGTLAHIALYDRPLSRAELDAHAQAFILNQA